MKTAKIPVFHNPEHYTHAGWVDDSGKQWDVPERVIHIVDALVGDSVLNLEWMLVVAAHPETRALLSSIHSHEMVEAISVASRESTYDNPRKTIFDKGRANDSSAIFPGTHEQALLSVECAVLAAKCLLDTTADNSIVISRPGGHHSGKDFYHGFCYLNPIAAAAEILKVGGNRVAIIDFDIHHGDGTQSIFYADPNVLYSSLHADPSIVMPGTGLEDETGATGAVGATVNKPLPIGVDVETYFQKLQDICERITEFKPTYLIVDAGFDGHKQEFVDLPPITQLGDEEYRTIGRTLGRLGIPSIVSFAGGYNQAVTAKAFRGFLGAFFNRDLPDPA